MTPPDDWAVVEEALDGAARHLCFTEKEPWLSAPAALARLRDEMHAWKMLDEEREAEIARLQECTVELKREVHAGEMLDEEREAEIARLREREAQLENVAEAAEAESRKNFDWAKAERSGRKQERTRADEAEARVAELDAMLVASEEHTQFHEARVARLEEALREIVGGPYDMDPSEKAGVMRQIARRALAHEEEA